MRAWEWVEERSSDARARSPSHRKRPRKLQRKESGQPPLRLRWNGAQMMQAWAIFIGSAFVCLPHISRKPVQGSPQPFFVHGSIPKISSVESVCRLREPEGFYESSPDDLIGIASEQTKYFPCAEVSAAAPQHTAGKGSPAEPLCRNYHSALGLGVVP
jgi:hypothetical protein